MSFELYTDASISRDIPESGLRRGDVVKLVELHDGPDGSQGYSAEVLNALGATLRVVAVAADALEPLRAEEILCVRPPAA